MPCKHWSLKNKDLFGLKEKKELCEMQKPQSLGHLLDGK